MAKKLYLYQTKMILIFFVAYYSKIGHGEILKAAFCTMKATDK